MKHLTISDYGTFLGVESGRLTVKQDNKKQQYPLNRLCTLSVAKDGVSLSSNLIEALSYRGIKLFFLDFKGTPYAQLIPANHHTVVGVRRHQMRFCDSPQHLTLANQIVRGKILNQRATLLYYSKYKSRPEQSEQFKIAAKRLDTILDDMRARKLDELLGSEGAAASVYFRALGETLLKDTSFRWREGRGSSEPINQMLNYGYGVLTNQITNCVFNAGLEPSLGVLHRTRPGKPALVLDMMEEYRAWVVDRAVLKLRHQAKTSGLSASLRKNLINQVMTNLHSKHRYQSKRLPLLYIMQRQMYRLAGHFAGNNRYRPFLFKW